jgi:hypothetical protein
VIGGAKTKSKTKSKTPTALEKINPRSSNTLQLRKQQQKTKNKKKLDKSDLIENIKDTIIGQLIIDNFSDNIFLNYELAEDNNMHLFNINMNGGRDTTFLSPNEQKLRSLNKPLKPSSIPQSVKSSSPLKSSQSTVNNTLKPSQKDLLINVITNVLNNFEINWNTSKKSLLEYINDNEKNQTRQQKN